MAVATEQQNGFDVLMFVGSVDTRIHVRTASWEAISKNLASSAGTIANVFVVAGVLSGHEEWVTTLHGSSVFRRSSPGGPGQSADTNEFLLASGSQDTKIRIWRVSFADTPATSAAGGAVNGGLNGAFDPDSSAAAGGTEDDEEEDDDDGEDGADVAGEGDDSDGAHAEARLVFSSAGTGRVFRVNLEALLFGHEDWVTAVQWLPPVSPSGARPSPVPRLFSASMDRNLVVWEPDSVSGVWSPQVRAGDIGGQLGGSVGGNLLGFVGGTVGPEGGSLLGLGYGGALHLWRQTEGEAGSSAWRPIPLLGGHFRSVNDLAWGSDGRFLVSVSSDQTCRLFAPVIGLDGKAARGCSGKGGGWREVSRPQVHGFDLRAVQLIDSRGRCNGFSDDGSDGTTPAGLPSLLLSAGDEKLIRGFAPSELVKDGLRKLCGLDSSSLPFS